ncbi:Oxysterol-binding protein-related protein 2A [Cardamine amara subsp. amara]|uniref:Oxysterol-binding protein-related protein 2A n=1 Tax=Cardamine amara subsp. amara TaxID=228776 RepID=A0ABD1C8T4_CARAN
MSIPSMKQRSTSMNLNVGSASNLSNSGCTYMKRKTKLPDIAEKEKADNLWSMIKDNVGKDLTRVYLPMYFNEPISRGQIDKEKSVNIWSMIKDNTGKYLTKVCLHVYFNEPSSLQKCFKDLEYSCLLDQVLECGKG